MNITPEAIMKLMYQNGIPSEQLESALIAYKGLLVAEAGAPAAEQTLDALLGNGHSSNGNGIVKATQISGYKAAVVGKAQTSNHVVADKGAPLEKVLAALRIGGTMQELIKKTGVTAPYAYEAINRLTKKGFKIDKQPSQVGRGNFFKLIEA